MPSSKNTVKKSAKKKTIKRSKKNASKQNDEKLKKELMNLAHTGTKEGLQKINDIVEKNKNDDLKEFAMLAYEECEFSYYFPENEQEEKDFLLAKMIYETEEFIDKLFQKGQSVEFKLNKLDLDRVVYNKILKSKKNQKFKHQFNRDYYNIVKNDLSEIEGEMDYKLLWVEEAKKMIKTEKYQKVSANVFEHLHLDGEADFCDDGWNEKDIRNFNYELDELMEYDEIDG